MSATKRQQRKAEERERRYSKLERQFREAAAESVSFMSDAKWRKALLVIAASKANVTGTAWKFLRENRIIVEDCAPDADEILDSHLCDGTFHYVSYKYIEWLDVITDQAGLLTKELSSAGQFEIETEDRRLRLFGYRPVK